MKTSKNIYFICDTIYPHKVGGAEIFNHYLVKELSAYHKTITVSSFERPAEILEEHYLKISTIKPLAIFFPIFIFFKLLILNTKNSLVVLTFTRSRWINWWPYPLLNWLKGLNYIIIIHGGGLTKWKWKFPYLKLFQKAQKIIGISERICDEYSKRSSRPILFLPPLIPFPLFEGTPSSARKLWDISNDKKVVLFAGSLKKLKNPDTIVKAVIQLKNNNTLPHNLLFVFAGTGSMQNQLRQMITQENISSSFLFTGFVPKEKINSLYAIADYYVCSSDFEGTPLSLLEAMVNHLLVICSDAPGLNNIIENKVNGYLFETKNHLQLAHLIQNINQLDNTAIREACFATYHKMFNYNAMLKHYLEIIDAA